MIVDVHTHLWPVEGIPLHVRKYATDRGVEPRSVGAEDLLESMDGAGIERAIVVALAGGPHVSSEALKVVNEHVRTEVRKSEGRLAGFCTLEPRSRDATSNLRRLIEDHGFRGLKLHGSIQEVAIDDPILWPLYSIMEDYELPVLLHTGNMGVSPYKDVYTRSELVDTVACDFPGLKLILGHACRIDYASAAQLLRKHKNVYAEISSNLGRTDDSWALRELIQNVKGWVGSTKQILFGSDFPLYSQMETRKALQGSSALSTDLVSSIEVEGILSENADPIWNLVAR